MIIVIGGAGYIGSHIVRELIKQQHRVVVFDNLSTGHRISVPMKAIFEKGCLSRPQDLDRVFARYSIDAVIHLASSSFDSVTNTLILLRKMREYGIQNLVFSSAAKVYGNVYQGCISESAKLCLMNEHGKTSAMIEELLEDFHHHHDLRYISLRYGNAAGACSTGEIGEDHKPETHLTPNVLLHLSQGTVLPNIQPVMQDYVHVTDIARAHVLAAESLIEEYKTNEIYNLGTERGFSNIEMIRLCKQVTGREMDTPAVREMTSPQLFVSSRKIMKE